MNRRHVLAQAPTLRAQLVERLALSDAVRWVALYGDVPGLADALGVRDELIREAVVVLHGQAPKPVVEWKFNAPTDIGNALYGMARRMRMTIAHLVRGVLHSAMQTSREPRRNPGEFAPRGEAGGQFRARMVRPTDSRKGFPDTNHRKLRVNRRTIHLRMTSGLREALDRRATAHGFTTRAYCVAWMADLVDGLLGDLSISAIEHDATFPFADNYVLPVVVASPPA